MNALKVDRWKILINAIMKIHKNRISEFVDYTNRIESKFDSEKDRLEKEYQEATKNLAEEETSEISDIFGDELHNIEEVNADIYRKSTLIFIYSFLENAMNNICRKSNTIYKYPVSLSDLKGSGVLRAKEYLSKLANVDFSELNEEWTNIVRLKDIRNCLVHNDGKIAGNKEEVLQYINSRSDLFIKNERYLKVEKDYIYFILHIIESFLDKIYQRVFSF